MAQSEFRAALSEAWVEVYNRVLEATFFNTSHYRYAGSLAKRLGYISVGEKATATAKIEETGLYIHNVEDLPPLETVRRKYYYDEFWTQLHENAMRRLRRLEKKINAAY